MFLDPPASLLIRLVYYMERKKYNKALRLKVLALILFTVLGILLTQAFSPDKTLSLFIGAILGIIGIVLTLIILQPLEKLVEIIESFTQGNQPAFADIRTNDEVEELANTFNLMASHTQKVIGKTEENHDAAVYERNKLDTILSSVIDGIIALDLSKNIILINQAAQNMTGFTKQEVLGHSIEQVIRLFDGNQELSSKSYCPLGITPDHPTIYTPEQPLTLVGKNGKQITIKLSSSQIPRGVETNIGCILILHDLTKEKELEQMKLDFVSMASHELRTPLTSILGYLSVFFQENSGKLTKDQKDLLDHVYISAKQLITLVENILNVNKIERGRLPTTVVPLNWQDTLAKTVQDIQNQAKLKNITLTLLPPREVLPKVVADPILVNEVLTNLISNAINYTKEGGAVNVFTKLGNNEVVTTVADTGIGIPKEAIPNLFTKFFRVSGTLVPGSKGTGLGLYISKSIINKLHGNIWVESEVGKGSQFSFSLPTENAAENVDLKEAVDRNTQIPTALV